MSELALTAIPNVSTSVPCVALPAGGVKCTCPTYGPGGAYLPIETAPDVWTCQLTLETPQLPPVSQAAPVPALSSVALGVLFVALAAVGAWRIQQ